MNAISATSSALAGGSGRVSRPPAPDSAAASPITVLLSGAATSFRTTAISSRDSAVSSSLDFTPSVDLLQQAAGMQGSAGSAEQPLLNLPPLAPMPAPKAAPAVPNDDHGQSNIVFSDSDGGTSVSLQ
jgi:hypothetical protein